jgi:hypothetical protein
VDELSGAGLRLSRTMCGELVIVSGEGDEWDDFDVAAI